MFDQLINSLKNFRVANQPIGEGAILTINMMISQIGMTLGKRIAAKMNIPIMPAKLLGDGVAAVGLPMLMKAAKLGGDNAVDRLSATIIGMSINDVVGTQQIVENMLRAIPFLSGADELNANAETYVEIPAEEVPYQITNRLSGANEFAGVAEEDLISNLMAIQK